tara:strand:+ start:149 stop:1108 length:960 start_codon:yes stop_codon:yes gene_type:complete
MSQDQNLMRLQKYIADCGVTSRRKAEDLIVQGRVRVNGKKVTELGTKVDAELDAVMVDGQPIDLMAVDHLYLLMNKPRSVMTTVSDPEGRKTVMDFVPIKTRVFPVGRLDYLSEGLLLLTNDGELANKIIHPSFGIVKTYEVKVFGRVNELVLKNLRSGINTSDGVLKPKSVRVIEQLPNKTWLEFRLEEGKNREIRKICEGHGVIIDKLKRVAIGGLSVDGIAPGNWVYLTKSELLKSMGLNKKGHKLPQVSEYQSDKKSISVKTISKKQKDAKPANAREYSRYRKEEYYETLRIQKEAQAKRDLEKKKESGARTISR